MMKPVKSLLLALLLASSLTLPAAQLFAALPASINQTLQRVGVPASHAAFLVVDTATGEALLSHRAEQAMHPASVMKLLTTAAALDLLSPSFTWKTEFLTTSVPINGVLHSPLYIRGVGDPKITWEDLEKVFLRLRAQGINELRGGIVVDRSRFAPVTESAADFDNRSLKPYNVLPDAALFNFKAVGFKFIADEATRQVNIVPQPYPQGVKINNQLRLNSGSCGDWRSKLSASFDDNDTAAQVSFSGTYSRECGEQEWFVSLLNHDAFLEGSLRWLWSTLGGTGIGAYRTGVIPTNAMVVETHSSLPLTAAVSDVNKFSNNVMARHLLLTLASQGNHHSNDVSATAAQGEAKVKQWLRKNNIGAAGLVIENGSGLSRIERISAQTLADLLRYMRSKPYFTDYRNSLPIAAVDGTLKSRFTHSAAANNAYLKTGSVDQVRTLAGYLTTPDGRLLIYIGLLNHPRANAAQAALDAGVEWAMNKPP